MNILVIGNGFDLAHGLPTKYTDFLDFMSDYTRYLNYPEHEWVWEVDKLGKKHLVKVF